MTPTDIEDIARILRRYDLAEISISVGDTRLRLVAGGETVAATEPPPSAPPAPVTPEATEVEIRAPMSGVFYVAPAPDAPPFVLPGAEVEAGQTLALLEAMKMLAPVEADAAGTVLTIHAQNGDTVQRGDLLVTLRGRG